MVADPGTNASELLMVRPPAGAPEAAPEAVTLLPHKTPYPVIDTGALTSPVPVSVPTEVLPTAILAVPSIAPLRTSVPALIRVLPVSVLVPHSVQVPAPSLFRPTG